VNSFDEYIERPNKAMHTDTQPRRAYVVAFPEAAWVGLPSVWQPKIQLNATRGCTNLPNMRLQATRYAGD